MVGAAPCHQCDDSRISCFPVILGLLVCQCIIRGVSPAVQDNRLQQQYEYSTYAYPMLLKNWYFLARPSISWYLHRLHIRQGGRQSKAVRTQSSRFGRDPCSVSRLACSHFCFFGGSG